MLRAYRLIWEILTSTERKNFIFVLLLSILMAFFETLGVAVILPFLKVLSDPDIIQQNEALTWAYNAIGSETPKDFIIALGIGAFVVIVVSMITRGFVTYALFRFSLMRSYSLSTRLLKGYLHQPYTWFLSQNSSELGQSLLSEVDLIVRECILPAVIFVFQALVSLLIVSLLFYIEPLVALGAFFVIGGTYLLVYLGLRKAMARVGVGRFEANKERFQVAQEATGGIKEIKVMSLEDVFVEQFRSPALRMAKFQTMGLIIGTIPRFVLEAVAFGGFIFFVLVMIIYRDAGIEDLLPLLGLIGMSATKLFPAIQQMYRQLTQIRMAAPAFEKLHHNLTTLNTNATVSKDVTPLGLQTEIALNTVDFRYPNTDINVLENFTMKIKAGSTVGFVGGTGAGKTTVVDMILGLLRPDLGSVTIDGAEIDKNNIAAWQKSIGYVPQSIFLTDDTLASNIAFGTSKDDIDLKAVEDAARAAELHDFVANDLPEGYQTIVGERGVRLSGGQRQRIGIARALYRSPDVLILDEATSALDNITERAVMKAVHNMAGSKTIIMIAHRLSTVKNCDTIFLLERGEMIDQGTFDELVERNITFKEMSRT